jgi:uncharacterized oligopeptide transporter (OPT) family protein
VTGFDFGLSFALLAVGHLVGLVGGHRDAGGRADRLGRACRTSRALAARRRSSADVAQSRTWSHKVRFVGAGTIGVAAIWTLAKLVKPVISGLRSAMAASRVRKPGRAPCCRVPSRTCRSAGSA